MAETKIEWCSTHLGNGIVVPGYTFNPWIGCTKVSEGCKHCYAEAQMDKWLGRVKWGLDGTRARTSVVNWKKPLTWNRKAPKEGIRPKVLCASLSDVFEDNPQLVRWRNELFLDLIDETPYLDWLLLTKRPENIKKGRMLPPHWRFQGMPDNVWLGTSVENQAAADERIPQLAAVPARVRFLSVEPLLGPVSLWEWLAPNSMYKAYCHQKRTGHKSYGSAIDDDAGNIKARCPDCEAVFCDNDPQVNWVIIGGESGPNARPLELAWVRDIVNQCRAAHVSAFVKQLGSVWAKQNGSRHRKGGDMAEWPTDLRVREQVDAGGLRIEQ